MNFAEYNEEVLTAFCNKYTSEKMGLSPAGSHIFYRLMVENMIPALNETWQKKGSKPNTCVESMLVAVIPDGLAGTRYFSLVVGVQKENAALYGFYIKEFAELENEAEANRVASEIENEGYGTLFSAGLLPQAADPTLN